MSSSQASPGWVSANRIRINITTPPATSFHFSTVGWTARFAAPRPASPVSPPTADQNPVDAGGDRTVAITGANAGDDPLGDDPRRDGVRDPILEPVAHLDANVVVFAENKQHHAVVDPFAAHAPALEGTNGPVLDGNAPHGPVDVDQNLMPATGVVSRQAIVEGGRGGR